MNTEDVETTEMDCLDNTEVEKWISVNTETVLLTGTKLNDFLKYSRSQLQNKQIKKMERT